MAYGPYSKATRETAENLRIIDDAMFRLVAERKEVCQEILRTLLDRPQLKVISASSRVCTGKSFWMYFALWRTERI